MGVLCFNLGGHDQMRERVGAYREALKHANPVGSFVNDQVAALCMVHCGQDDEEARRVAGPEGVWFVEKAASLYGGWQGRQVPDSYKFAINAVQQERIEKTAEDHLASGAFAMGDPDTVIEVIKGYQDAGVDQILCFMQMGNLAHTRIMDSIKLFGPPRDPALQIELSNPMCKFLYRHPERSEGSGGVRAAPRSRSFASLRMTFSRYSVTSSR